MTRLDSPTLSMAITSTSWQDRQLRTLRNVHAEIRCAWIATGNNPSLSNEIKRRTVRIRLDAKIEQPWLRQNFRHPNLREWATEHRGDLIWAALVLIQAWIAAGRPIPKEIPKLGMFESYSSTMAGILDVAGIPGFLRNLEAFYEQPDAEEEENRLLVIAWNRRFGSTPVGVSDLWLLIREVALAIDLGDKGQRSEKTKLGFRLGTLRDRQIAGFSIQSAGERQGAQLWKLIPVEANGENASDEVREPCLTSKT